MTSGISVIRFVFAPGKNPWGGARQDRGSFPPPLDAADRPMEEVGQRSFHNGMAKKGRRQRAIGRQDQAGAPSRP